MTSLSCQPNSPPTHRLPDATHTLQLMSGGKIETLRAFGGALMGDGAAVNSQPLTNAMLVLPDEKPICLEIANVAHLIRKGGKKDDLYYAEQLTEYAKKTTPDNGLHVDLLITDTPSDMQRCWRISMQLFPWLFCQPCVSHCGNVLLKKIAAIPVVSYMLDWLLEVGAASPITRPTLSPRHLPALPHRDSAHCPSLTTAIAAIQP